jgi:hypothetical protein
MSHMDRVAARIELALRSDGVLEEELTPETIADRKAISEEYGRLKSEFNPETPGYKHSFSSAARVARRAAIVRILRDEADNCTKERCKGDMP